jgi:hypothetical protein
MPFFYRITKPFATGVGGTTPGAVSSFSYVYTANSLEEYTCNSGNSIDFSWSAPSDDGGSAITGYVIRRIGVDWIEGTTGLSIF